MKFEKLSVKSLDRQGLITEVNKYENGTIEFKEGFAFIDYLGRFDEKTVAVYSGGYWFDIEPKKEE